MTLRISPLRLTVLILVYMIALVGLLSLILVWLVPAQPPDGRPLRTRPPVERLDPPTT